jgi:biopolymer transport protein ExbD
VKIKELAMPMPGIPCKDSTNNEMTEWLRLVKKCLHGAENELVLVKGDNTSKYPSFKNVITAFKKNDLLKVSNYYQS